MTTRARRFRVAAPLLLSLLTSGCARDAPQGFLKPVGEAARKADALWDVVFLIAVVIFVIVEGLLVFAIIRFRHRPGRKPAQFEGNPRLEVILVLIPALILAGIAIPTVRTIFDLAEAPPKAERLDVTVIAHQFWWEYRYPDLGIETANELHIPTGKPVYVSLESADVIHSFWVPKLSGKQDNVPGYVNYLTLETDRPGTYFGQCAEYCGLSHANMRLRVVAQTPEGFAQWVAQQQEPSETPNVPLARKGRQLFLQGACAGCHAIEGTDAQGDVGPDLTHFASRRRFAGAIFESTADDLVAWLRDPPAVKPGAKMPDLGLSEDQIEALVAYLRTLR